MKTIRWIVVIEMVRFERIFSKKKGVRTAISITTDLTFCGQEREWIRQQPKSS